MIENLLKFSGGVTSFSNGTLWPNFSSQACSAGERGGAAVPAGGSGCYERRRDTGSRSSLRPFCRRDGIVGPVWF